MTDTVSLLTRHITMAAVKSSGTSPELIVRKYLFGCGFRYRLNNPRLPGHPDIVLPKYRTCIFVNGCFWHGHDGCKYYTIPKTNTAFWAEKIARNKDRDKQEQQQLAKMGWHCITVWGCELKPKKREKTLEALAFTLNRIYLQDHSVRYESPQEDGQTDMAAEQSIGTDSIF